MATSPLRAGLQHHENILRRAKRVALLLLALLPAAMPQCAPWCEENECSTLNGDIYAECGGCLPHSACSPSHTKPELLPRALDPYPSEPEGLPHTLNLLWPSAFYNATLPDVAAHNAELAAIVTQRFEGWLATNKQFANLNGLALNEKFHDSHRPQLRKAFQAARICVAEGGAASACEDAAYASSAWPELLNSAAFRALFGLENGLIWRHFAQYTSILSQGRAPGLPVSFEIWATFHQRGIEHPSHSHDGSKVSGVYYVRDGQGGKAGGGEAEGGEVGGILRVADPRHIQLQYPWNPRRVTDSEHFIYPLPGSLAFWPSYLQHAVTPTRGFSPRISLAMDLHMIDPTGDMLWPIRVVRPSAQAALDSALDSARSASSSSAAAESVRASTAVVDDASEDEDESFDIRPFVCRGMPQWMRQAILAFSGDASRVSGGGADGSAERDCPSRGPPLQEGPPSFEGQVRLVRRARGLNASEFYARHARPGVPVILEGALEAPDASARTEAIRSCCLREYDHKARAHRTAAAAGAATKPCDLYDPDTWCEKGVQLCGRHPEHDCAAEAALDDLARLPAGLRGALEMPPPLPPLHEITARFGEPYIFWSQPSHTFGGPDHFDMICTGTLSMQHKGRKKWTLWAPWELIDSDGTPIPAHARFEVTANPGDVLYYPPAWFHATSVEPGDESITTAVDLLAVPSFGTLAGRSLLSPFGYGSCAAGTNGWHAQSQRWDQTLLPSDQTTGLGSGRVDAWKHGSTSRQRDEL